MVAKFVIAPLALDDIDALTDWMRQTDPTSDFDLRFIDTVYQAFEFLAENPGVGHKRTDLTDQHVLFWTVLKSFAVVYRIGSSLEIVRVTRWTRNIPMLLAAEHR